MHNENGLLDWKHLVREIKSRVQIRELADACGLNVRRNGFICSIYQQEKTPSMHLKAATNRFSDYSSGNRGDVIQFYMDVRKLSFKEAVLALAELYHIPHNFSKDRYAGSYSRTKQPSRQLPEIISVEKFNMLEEEKGVFYERACIMEYEGGLSRYEADQGAKEHIMDNRKEIQMDIYDALYEHCSDYTGRCGPFWEYLTGSERKLLPETIRKYRLFALPDDAEDFLQDNYDANELILAGLYNAAGWFIFTYNRLIIPYLKDGEITYLRGRHFPASLAGAKDKKKYLGLINFSTNLTTVRFYNADLFNEIEKGSRLIITEGEFDCMIVNQCGEHAVGVPGVSNFPFNKMDILMDYDVYLGFDNDKPGQDAMQKIAECLPRRLKMIKLHNAKDLTEALV